MARVRAVPAVLALVAPWLVIAPLMAAEAAPAALARAADASARRDPNNVTAISPWMELYVRGNEKYAAQDYAGAVALYQQAIRLAPTQALGHYLLGEAYVASQKLPEAAASFAKARDLAGKDPGLRSHALFSLADAYERQHELAKARAAWEAYTKQAASVGDAGAYPDAAATRIQLIAQLTKLEKDYAAVRARIEAERDASADAKK